MTRGASTPRRRRSRANPQGSITFADLRDQIDAATLQAALLICAAVLLGGGGIGAGFFNLAVQAAALALLAINFPAVRDFVRTAPRPLVVLTALTLLLPLSQMVPLPPAIWQSLPGRDLEIQALSIIGQEDSWRPFSVDPRRTLLAAIGLVAPFAVLVLVWALRSRALTTVLLIVIGLGLFETIFGAAQLVTGNGFGTFANQRINSDHLYATFANHNSSGIFFVSAMICALGLAVVARQRGNWPVPAFILAGLFALCVILTQSRSATLVMAVVIFIAAILSTRPSIAGGRTGNAGRSRTFIALAIAAAVPVLFGGLWMSQNERIGQSVERFGSLDEDRRPAVWEDAAYSLSRFFPAGSGAGTFDEVFQIDELLETLSPGRVARAHNDYLEVMIEHGITGLALIAAWFAALIWLFVRALRISSGPAEIAPVIAAGGVLAAIMAQSLVDLPLRNQAGLCLAAAMIAALARSAVERGRKRPPSVSKRNA